MKLKLDERKRAVVFRGRIGKFSAELVRIDWAPGAHAGWHDHGAARGPGSHGLTYVLQGELCEEVLKGGKKKIIRHKAGTTFKEKPDTIHRVWSRRGAISLHWYTPPVTGTMKHDFPFLSAG